MDARGSLIRASQGTVKVRNISAIPDVLIEVGVDVEEVLAKVGLEPSLFSNPEQTISYSSFGRLLSECARTSRCEDFGLQVGMRQSAPILGLSGYVAANAPTVRDALETIVGSLRLSDTGGVASLHIERGFASLRWVVIEPSIEAMEHIDDAAIAIGYNILRSICGPQWRPTEVCLTRRRPESAARYLKFFGAPVRFETDGACIIFEAAHLDHGVEGRDANLHTILSPLLEKAIAETDESFKDEVCNILRAQVLNTPLSPDRAASALGMSARTMSRRLAEEDSSFSQLAQIVRFETAERLLRTDKSLSDIAGVLGYSGPTAFIRAFKQFNGKTPARWRRDV